MSYQIYTYIIYTWIAIGIITFFYLLFKQSAPYGRHTRPGWGKEISNRLGWVIMETPVMLFVLLFFSLGTNPNPSQWVYFFMALFFLHYIHRSFVFPAFIRTQGKKMPLIIALSAMGFNLMNGFGFGYYWGSFAEYPTDWLTDWRFLSGITLFLGGMIINMWADYTLINLRKEGETGYKIPKGFLFEYISCPNHFGEMIEWAGFALMTWSLPALTFWVWTISNLIPRTLAHHKWYQEKFADYPKHRKAFLPFLW